MKPTLIYGANEENWETMADLCKKNSAALTVISENLDSIAELTEKIKLKGVDDIVIDPSPPNLSSALNLNTQIRRQSLKKNFKPLGFPIIAFPSNQTAATQAISKYAGFVVLDSFEKN